MMTLVRVCASFVALAAFGLPAGAGEERFRAEVEPILADHCYGCHGEGMKKGGLALDELTGDNPEHRELWWKVLKNVRAGIMPPPDKPRPSNTEIQTLADWIKRGAFGLEPADPDPGRVTLRRLNRVEYRNTIRDLMGIDFNAEEEFPPDDTGYGFDTIGDVLTVSPLLLEKYMQAAETIVATAVPTVARMVATRTITGNEFRGPDGQRGAKISVYDAAKVEHTFKADQEGTYRLVVELSLRGDFDFDPGRCRLTFKADDQELLREEYGWQDGKKYHYEFTRHWSPGEHRLVFEAEPLTPRDQKKTNIDLRIGTVQVEGPTEPELWVRPKNFDRFFAGNDPGTTQERAEYIKQNLRRFATRAFRRPVDDRTVDRLAAIAEAYLEQPGKTVPEGIARGMVAVLSSPRFLFRTEASVDEWSARRFPMVDEYALATRLSYFLWSTLPDDELMRLAEQNQLRKNLDAQVRRLLADPRSERLIKNFTGQWLQVRDLQGIAIDARSVLARDDGEEKELQRELNEFRAFLAERAAQRKKAGQDQKPGQDRGAIREKFSRVFRKPRVELDDPLRNAMRRETEMYCAAVVQEDRSVLDLIDSDFTFLNEKLAKHYGIPDVTGNEMRRVTLPKDSPRGGLLTQGTVLIVTSNSTRTSPVKRGLFLLDNFLGTPPPPPPPDIPQLEDSEKEFKDREPTLREVLAVHRAKPLCSSCHARMDPLGLAFENFNALGLWREKERNQPLDVAGQLATGEAFGDVRALKRMIKEQHRGDFYRCLTEKLLTYALGRGLEYYDVETVDQIVERLERSEGRFSALLLGVIEAAPFQRRRQVAAAGS
jgi:hypothetical protein